MTPFSAFDCLSPDAALEAVEDAYNLDLDGTVETYPSYVNRVYGFRGSDGKAYVAKFYRPGRWSRGTILEEHQFIADCAAAELPVAVPISLPGGGSLAELALEIDPPSGADGPSEDGQAAPISGAPSEADFCFALFPRMGGRNFEPESDEDWIRLGSIVGRLHSVGRERPAPHRLKMGPALTASHIDSLLEEGLIHADCRAEFEELARSGLELIAPRFEGITLQRIHGDLHRGNILDRGESGGLLLIDFDDMLMGPAIQDLWLLLPGRAAESGREIGCLSEGYEEFGAIDPRQFGLIEPLRFMRMLYFLSWRASQRGDYWFRREFPDWGSRAFWLKEVEDLRDQVEVIRALNAEPGIDEEADEENY